MERGQAATEITFTGSPRQTSRGGLAANPAGRRWSWRWVRRAPQVVICALVATLLAALLAVTLPSFAGFHSVTIYGGSMGSALPAGSVAVTRPVDAADLRVGDIIAIGHGLGGLPTLHRIVAMEVDGGRRVVTTRGDANKTNDPQSMTIAGPGDRVVFHVPLIGYVLAFTRTGLGMLLLVSPGAFWLCRRLIAGARARQARGAVSP
jgi:signal peptidase I